MPAGPIQPAVLDARQRAQYVAALDAAPPPANLDAATTAHDEGEIIYRGRRYRTRPTPYRAGVMLAALDFERRQLEVAVPSAEVLRQMLRVLDAQTEIVAGLVRWPRWRAWLGRRAHPFRDPERGELEALVAFFSSARTRSPVYGRVSVRAPRWLQPIWATGSVNLRVGIHAGWRRARPAAIGTTNWASSVLDTSSFAPAASPAR
jgi:hypothetical protein